MPKIFNSSVLFYKCGFGAVLLESNVFRQHDFFSDHNDNPEFMNCFDAINDRYGNGTIQIAAQGYDKSWSMKRELLSKRFTTSWLDIPMIDC